MASYLGRHVNLALLIIIIGVVVAMVGTTVFFQRSLQNRTNAYEDTTQTLDQCQVSLSNFQNKYSEAQQRVTETSADIKKYDSLYEQKVAELDQTRDNLADTERQRAFEQLQKEKFQDLYEDEQRKVRERDQTISAKNDEIARLEEDIEDLEAQCSA